MLAGSKQGVVLYQGISFFKPFFFLLVDSWLESLGAACAGCSACCVEPLGRGGASRTSHSRRLCWTSSKRTMTSPQPSLVARRQSFRLSQRAPSAQLRACLRRWMAAV